MKPDNQLYKVAAARLTPDEHRALLRAARKARLSVSQFLRQLISSAVAVPR
jgi:hypothetical protein